MKDYLLTWLQDKMGVIVSADEISVALKDGMIFIRILKYYNAINVSSIKNVFPSDNDDICRNNLVQLKIWFKLLEIDFTDEIINEIIVGNTPLCYRVLYQLFVLFEKHSNLHFISKQKERSIMKQCDERFKVSLAEPKREQVKETGGGSSVYEFEDGILKNKDLISWFEEKHGKTKQCFCNKTEPVASNEFDNKFGKFISLRSSNVKPRLMLRKCCDDDIAYVKHEINKPSKVSLASSSIDCLRNQPIQKDTRMSKKFTSYDCNILSLDNSVRNNFLPPLKNKPDCEYDLPPDVLHYMKVLKTTSGFLCKRLPEDSYDIMVMNSLWDLSLDNEASDLKKIFACRLLKQSLYEKEMSTKFVSIMSQNEIQKQCYTEFESRLNVSKSTSNDVPLADIENSNGEFVNIDKADCDDDDDDDNSNDDSYFNNKLRYIHSHYDQYYQSEQKRTIELHRKLYAEKLKLRFERHYALCLNAVTDLVDLAIRLSEYKKKYGFELSTTIWNDWKCLFHNEQPIFDVVSSVESLLFPDDPYGLNFREELTRQNVLNDYHLSMYLEANGIWNYLSNVIDEDVINSDSRNQLYTVSHESQILLGYVVHRVLELKYPVPQQRQPADIPRYPVTAVINGIEDLEVIKNLKDLFMTVDLLLIDVNTAINFCLKCYKGEVDNGNFKMFSQELDRINLGEDGNELEEEIVENRIVDDFTQTSSSEFALMSASQLDDATKVGYDLFETILSGNEIPITTVVNAVIQYIKEHEHKIKGWVLLNFPSTLYQASITESFLLGKKFPFHLEDDTVSTSSSEVCTAKDLGIDSSTNLEVELKSSSIVPNPNTDSDNDSFKTYFTIYISTVYSKLLKADNGNLGNTITSEHSESTLLLEQPEKEGVPTLHYFYKDQGIIYDFLYETFDNNALNHLVHAVLLNYLEDPRVQRPDDLYTDDILKHIEPSFSLKLFDPTSDEVSGNRLKSLANINEAEEQESDGLTHNDGTAINKAEETVWIYTNLPIMDSAVIALATFWEALETVYISNLKNVLFLMRNTNYVSIYYISYIIKQFNLLINREDERQKIVTEFLEAYNSIHQFLRSDSEMKCELHLRVIELKERLTKLCEKNWEVNEEVQREIINQNWTYQEMALYANYFIKLIQIELERCLNTLEFLKDYYLAMLENYNSQPLPSVTISEMNVYMGDQVFEEDFYNDSEDEYGFTIKVEPSIEIKRNPEDVNDELYSSVVHGILHFNEFEEYESPFYSILVKKISKSLNEIVKVKSRLDSIISSEESAVFKKIKDNTSKQKSSNTGKTKEKDKKAAKTSEPLPASEKENETKELAIKNLFEEWRTAIRNEVDRFTFRTELIKFCGYKNFLSIMELMSNEFFEMKNRIDYRLSNETTCINNICKLFQYAIEEKTPINADLIFHQDIFYTIEHPSEGSAPSVAIPAALDEMLFEESFTIKQLEVIMDRLMHIAPTGAISRGAFIDFIQSITCHTYSKENIKLVPNIWSRLEPNELDRVFQKVFGNLGIVQWRDFLVCCLDLPNPVTEDIIDARLQFLQYDLEETEMISYEDYMKTTLWFHRELPENPLHALRNVLAKQFIFSLFNNESSTLNYVTLLASFCKDVDPKVGFGKGLSLLYGRCVIVYSEDLYLEDILFDHIDTGFKIANGIINEIITDIVCHSIDNERLTISKIKDAMLGQTVSNLSVDKNNDDKNIFNESMYHQLFRKHQILRWTSRIPNAVVVALLFVSYSAVYVPGHRYLDSEVLKAIQQYMTHYNEDYIYVPDFLESWWMESMLEAVPKFKAFSLINVIKTIIKERNQ